MKEKKIIYLLAAVSLTFPIVFIIILAHVIYEAIPAITQVGLGLFESAGTWRPLSLYPSYSILPMILGSFYVSFLAVTIAAVIGCSSAIFLNYYIDKKLARIILSFIDLLAGIPSVIYGFLGIIIIVSNFERIFGMSAGESILAAIILLSVMLLPYIISGYSESIEMAKNKYNIAAFALGLSPEYTIFRLIIPSTKKAAAAAVVSAFGRGMAETIAVMMVIGNAPIFPRLLGRGQTIPALTALEIGSAEYGSLHLSAIYAANLTMIILLGLILITTQILKRSLKEDEILS